MSDELLDLVNKNDEVIGTVWKSEAHKSLKKLHREIAIVAFNDEGETLIQQRSISKINDPGVWKITAAGHVGASEDPKKAAEREVLEELGLKVDAKFLKKVFMKRDGKKGTTEARFIYIYYTILKGRPKLKLDKEEVDNTRWIKPNDLYKFAETNNWEVTRPSHKLIFEVKKLLKIN